MFGKLALIMALVALLGAAPSASALGIDLNRPKKEKKDDKKKADNKAETKTEDKPADTKKDDPSDSYAKQSEETLKAVGPRIDRVLEAYNKDDVKAFFAEYAPSVAEKLGNEQTYNALYTRYKDQFGKYVSKKLAKERCSLAKEAGLVSYDAEFEKNKQVRIDVNYLLEDGAQKLMQVQFNAAGGSAPKTGAAAPVAPGGISEVKVAKSGWDQLGGNFKAGDWVEYEYPAAAGMKSRMEITEVGDHFVVVVTKMTMNGTVHESKGKWIYSEPDGQVQGMKMETKKSDDKVEVPGKGEVAATRYETYINDKLMGKSWITPEVPITGIAKSEGPDGKVAQKLIAFGRGK